MTATATSSSSRPPASARVRVGAGICLSSRERREVLSVYFHSYDYRWELEKNVESNEKEEIQEGKGPEDDSCPKTRNQESGFSW